MKNSVKKLMGIVMFLALAAALVIGFQPGKAHASISNLTSQLGAYNSTDGTYGLEVDNNNQFHFSLTGSGIYYPVVNINTETTLLATQSGQTIVSTMAYGIMPGGTSRIVLPTAVPGMTFTYIASTTEEIQVQPQTGDTIDYSTLTAGQSLDNTTKAAGDHLQVFCNAANTWQIFDIQGTWAHGTP